MASGSSGSIAAIRCGPTPYCKRICTQFLRVALQPIVRLDSKCLCANSFSLDGGACVGALGKVRAACRQEELARSQV